jgi:hypothetical protein
VIDKKVIRQQQAQALMRENAIGIMELAACLGLDEVKLEAMVGEGATRQLSDSSARLMEQTFSKPAGWMDSNEDGGISFDLFG